MKTPKLDIWSESYDELVDAKNNIKQKNLSTVFAHISTTFDLLPLDRVTNV